MSGIETSPVTSKRKQRRRKQHSESNQNPRIKVGKSVLPLPLKTKLNLMVKIKLSFEANRAKMRNKFTKCDHVFLIVYYKSTLRQFSKTLNGYCNFNKCDLDINKQGKDKDLY